MKKLFSCFMWIGAILILTGFNMDNALVPKDEIFSGGVPRDGIPAILKPKFVEPNQTRFLNPDDKVIGVRIGGQAKAYPIRILNLHEVVNDTLSKLPIAVTF
jgi:hypothetical protein